MKVWHGVLICCLIRPSFNPATPFEGLAEDLASDRIYENRIMNSYEEDIKQVIKFTQDKFIPEYIYHVPREDSGNEETGVEETGDEENRARRNE